MVEIKSFANGFEYIEISNTSAKAKIALNGAHIFEYSVHGEDDLLWLSSESAFKNGSAIRGGIPICWPSFGTNNPQLPQHGFARTSLFTLLSYEELTPDATQLIFMLTDSTQTHKIWDYNFELQIKFSIADTLSVEITTTNKDKKEFVLTQALHSYFNISNIENVTIKGLDDKPYFDALLHQQKHFYGDIKFTQEFDVVFQNIDAPILLKDTDRTTQITTQGASSCVVWNPWIKKCSTMSAMLPLAYREFVCIETANAYEDFKLLKPNDSHTLKATFKTL